MIVGGRNLLFLWVEKIYNKALPPCPQPCAVYIYNMRNLMITFYYGQGDWIRTCPRHMKVKLNVQ